MLKAHVVQSIVDIIDRHNTGQERQDLLDALLERPEQVHSWICGNLHPFTAMAAANLREAVVMDDIEVCVGQIVCALKEKLSPGFSGRQESELPQK